MYKTCMFCKKSLGSNEVVESFPVGRRLAFDAAKGRLWVVCRKCQRWNLTPLEERWEAVEDCERLFRGTPMRTSTENIGIARHREGLELVRIGKPPRGEFAAWRYGDQFGRRRRRALGWSAVGYAMGWAIAPAVSTLATVALVPGYLAWWRWYPYAKVRLGGEAVDSGAVTAADIVAFSYRDVETTRLLPAGEDTGFRIEIGPGRRKAAFEGEDARRVAVSIVPHLNWWGGSRPTVERAVGEIEGRGHPEGFLSRVPVPSDWRGRVGYVKALPSSTRLALEMALHEEQERRALEGELWILERAWKEAEEIAAIADNLFLPAGTDAFFDRYGQDS